LRSPRSASLGSTTAAFRVDFGVAKGWRRNAAALGRSDRLGYRRCGGL
jgi:hypothetical protein